MRTDSCRRCGKELSIKENCNKCEKPVSFECKPCDIQLEKQFHTNCATA